MNLHAVWAYGAGITTGFLWPHAKYRYFMRGEYRFLTQFYLVIILLLAWPLFALYLVIDPQAKELRKKPE